MDKWLVTALVLCTYGMLKEFKPSEPYLYRYQQRNLNISGDVLTAEVYPYWTYSYLLFLVPAFLLTDVLLYKPILILESISYISVWITLIFGRSVFSQQLGQVLYGCATATEVAYFAYIYVKVDRSKYALVTVWTRAALQIGKCFSYILSQFIIMYNWGDLLTLNYISLGSLILTFFFAVALPFVSWRTVVERHWNNCIINRKSTCTSLQIGTVRPLHIQESRKPPKSYCEFVACRFREFFTQFRAFFADFHLMKWSLCWALASCGDLMVGNYIQVLWGEAQKDMHNAKVYNGFVEGAIPFLSAMTLMGLQKPRVDWDKHGELCLAVAALVQFVVILIMSLAESVYVMYACYALFRIVFQCMITIAQFNIVCRIAANSTGFVFGFNMFTALALQTIVTFIVVDGRGLALFIRTQFLVYAGYHAFIAVVYTLLGIEGILFQCSDHILKFILTNIEQISRDKDKKKIMLWVIFLLFIATEYAEVNGSDHSNVSTTDVYNITSDQSGARLFKNTTEWTIKKSFFWRDFDIFDEHGEKIFEAETKLFAFLYKLTFKDLRENGDEIGRIEQNFALFHHEYEIYIDGALYATMSRKFTFFSRQFSVEPAKNQGNPITISSDWTRHNYEFHQNDILIATVHKHWFSWTNTYSVTIMPEQDVVFILSCCAVIDKVVEKESSDSESSKKG
ncbi:reduced folate carrier domain-containing protein [Ditylenchus destructor]|nr:reduced folate carrier domain-containing protein [Ditylenchus destructor]